MFNPALRERRRRKLELLELIKEEKHAPLQKILALYSLKTGLKRNTVVEYYKELLEAGVIQDNEYTIDKRGNFQRLEGAKRAD